MKKMQNTLYVTTPESYLGLEGETIVVKRPDLEDVRVPMHNLEAVIAFGHAGASPALLGALPRHNIALSFFTPHGRLLARVVGESHGNVLLRKAQYRASDDPARSLEIARLLIGSKLHNSRWILERALRDHGLRVNADAIGRACAFIQSSIATSRQASSLEALRGIEGEGASRYFGVFDELILQQKSSFSFQGRNRRPPMDNVNAMLSFGYAILASDLAAALEGVGLDAYVGFLHRDRPGRISLALDMMEELRGCMIDRLVLSLINKKMVDAKGFKKEESGAVTMSDDTRGVFLRAWQERKREEITHPYLGEKLPWGLVPHAQALLLARYLRGDLDAYPVFLWK